MLIGEEQCAWRLRATNHYRHDNHDRLWLQRVEILQRRAYRSNDLKTRGMTIEPEICSPFIPFKVTKITTYFNRLIKEKNKTRF